MEEALAKIRPHTSSSLAHQKTPATLLIAIESTLHEQKTDLSPTAYFAALLTTLDGSIQKKDISLNDGDVLPAELYLLALVVPFVPLPVVRNNLNTLLSLTAPLFPSLNQHAPALRSQLSIYLTIFHSLDRPLLETQGIRQTFASILQLSIDPRPKVRKKAADLVKDVLDNPPAPLARHPYSDQVAAWLTSALSEANAGPFAKAKPGAESSLHVLALLRPLLPNLPSSALPTITKSLVSLPRLGNVYLSQSAYYILSEILALPLEHSASGVSEQLSDILKVILSSPPSKSDATLCAAWVQALGDATFAYGVVDSSSCSAELGKVWKSVWSILDSSDPTTRKSAAKALDVLTRCFSPRLIESAIADTNEASLIRKIISQVTKAMNSIAFARAMPELLTVVSALFSNLRYKPSKASPTAAESLLLPIVSQLGHMRIQKGFDFKEAADATLSAAMRVLGPEVVFKVLPLNLEPGIRQPGQEPRAFLLPLIAQPHPSPLGHFVSYFVPLSERMFDLQQTAATQGRLSEAKVWNVLVGQVWSGLSGYCFETPDLKEALNPAFSQLLSQLLYSQSELRPAILKALKILVDSNLAISASNAPQTSLTSLTPQKAAANVAFLRTQVESWLAVLFNVFGSIGRDSRGMVGDVITAWASIGEEQEIHKAYDKVVQLLKSNLAMCQKGPATTAIESNDAGNMTTTSQDILILLLPYLSPADSMALFDLCLTPEILNGRNNGIQKRGYKILTKLVDGGKILVNAETIVRKLEEMMDGLTPAAKKDRFNLLALLIPLLPPSAMHVIPALIPEAILGTKEPSEKARGAAFDVILVMGRKMSSGGVVKRSMVDGMDEDAVDAKASIEEFMTMVVGGLAGASPHMISATITAISRLVFEFKDSISPNMHSEIFLMLLVFLSSANREIVKSVLGFIKLAIHTLPADLIRPHLKDLVPTLLNWSHDHKNHFKVKVRHIFERMLRRFSWDEVYSCAGEEEAAKVLVNIKKRKDRAKRKRANKPDEDEDAKEPTFSKPAAGDAFEDVLYGSESELDDDSEDDRPTSQVQSSKKKAKDYGARLRLDDDEPTDLLQGATSKITNSGPNRRRKPGQDAAHFKTDEDTGKMIIDADSDSGASSGAHATAEVVGSAYKESLTSVDGFTRGPNGRIKFHKDTKKRRRENEGAEQDVEMADAEVQETGKAKKSKKTSEIKLGHEFKAKKAGGDVKKGGVDPYAYLSLSQAAKKGGRGSSKIGITGKR